MATENTLYDGVRFYHTSASFAGEYIYNPDESLGPYQASTEVHPVIFLVDTSDPRTTKNVRIDYVWSGVQTTGTGTISCPTTGTLAYTAPGDSTAGTAVAISNGETKVLESASTGEVIRVTRTSTNDLIDTLSFSILPNMNGVIGFTDETVDDATEHYLDFHAIQIVPNTSAYASIQVEVGLPTAPSATSSTSVDSQLGISGAGTVGKSAGVELAAWPARGLCVIKESGGTIREVVRYSSRTDYAITVAATGARALFGTTSAAGLATDTMHLFMDNYIFAPETSSFSTIASSSTYPTSVGVADWVADTLAGSPLTFDFSGYSTAQLWIARYVDNITDSGAGVNSDKRVEIKVTTTTPAQTYTTYFQDGYRTSVGSGQYELYVGEDTEPTFTSPDDSGALDLEYTVTPPGSGTTDFKVTGRYRSKYDLVSQNEYSQNFEIDDAGDEVVDELTAPTDVVLSNLAGGYMQIRANYNSTLDPTPADYFTYFITEDGTTPDPDVLTGTEVLMVRDYMFNSTQKLLDVTLGPYPYNATIKVLVRALRDSDNKESPNTTPASTVVTTKPPAAFVPTTSLGNQYAQNQDFTFTPITTYIDQPNNIFWLQSSGRTELWGDTTRILRFDYSSSDTSFTQSAIYTTYDIQTATVAGTPAGGETTVEVGAWAAQKTLYFIVGGTRALEIDVTAGIIIFSDLHEVPSEVVSYRTSDPYKSFIATSCIQVFDPSTFTYESTISGDTSDIWYQNVPWRQLSSW